MCAAAPSSLCGAMPYIAMWQITVTSAPKDIATGIQALSELAAEAFTASSYHEVLSETEYNPDSDARSMNYKTVSERARLVRGCSLARAAPECCQVLDESVVGTSAAGGSSGAA